MKTVDMAGTTINGIFVIARNGSGNGKALWNCRCACSAVFPAIGTALRQGRLHGCPKCAKARIVAAATKHGLVGTREYNSYNAMKSRCYNPKDKRYSRYGGRGIEVCERWLESFTNFISDMGMQPSSDHSIERVERDKSYEPGNCVWATRVEQANNRSNNTVLEINGRTQTMVQWSRESGVNRTVILRRMKRGIVGESLINKGVLL